MDDIQIKLSGLWIAVMLTYLLGDVLRIFSGEFTPREIEGQQVPKIAYLGIAVLMVIPIIMVVVSLLSGNPVNRWSNIIVAIFFFGFNLFGLPTYPSAYDRFLLVVSMVFNLITIWQAWNWK